MIKGLLTGLILIFFSVCLFTRFAMPADVTMMTKDELKAKLGNPNLIILDLRLSSDYFSSDLKIKGAERPLSFHDLPSQYPDDKTLVLYCASPQERTSAATAKRFIERGFTKIYVLKGGWEEWLKADYPTEKK